MKKIIITKQLPARNPPLANLAAASSIIDADDHGDRRTVTSIELRGIGREGRGPLFVPRSAREREGRTWWWRKEDVFCREDDSSDSPLFFDFLSSLYFVECGIKIFRIFRDRRDILLLFAN